MDTSKISERTRRQLDKLPPEARAKAEAAIARTQTPEYRAREAADRAALDREYRETGRIATRGEKTHPEDAAAFRQFIETLRDERLTRGLSLEELALRSKIDKAGLNRLEGGKQANPTVATLMRYSRALGMRLTLSLEPLPGAAEGSSDPHPASPTEGQPTILKTREFGVELAVSGYGKPYIMAQSDDYQTFRVYLDALGIPFSARKGKDMGTIVIVPDPAIDHDRLRELVDRWTNAMAANRS